MLAYLRWGSDGSVVACVLNFAPMPHSGYRIGLPFAGRLAGGGEHRLRALRRVRRRQHGRGGGLRAPVARAAGVGDDHHPAAGRAVVGAGIGE